MEIVRLAIALLLPWLLGIVWLRWRWHTAPHGAWPMVLGYGYIIGILTTTLIIRLIDALGLRLDFTLITLVLALLTILGAWLSRNIPWRGWSSGASWRDQPLWQKWLFGILLTLIVIRFTGFALEIIWRPLYPWDAWNSWGVKARIWFEHQNLVDILHPGQWLNAAPTEAYNSYGTGHPATVSLIQTWSALGLGHWDDTAINLPWLLCAIALGLAFYGQSRIWGISPLMAMLFTYLLLSLPLLNSHIALAGYGDLWLAAGYGLAVMAFFQWARTRDRRQGILAFIFLFTPLMLKESGVIFTATFIPAMLALFLPRKIFLVTTVILLGSVGWIFLSGGIQYEIPILGQLAIGPKGIKFPYIGTMRFIEYQSAVWDSFLKNYFFLDNWHLFWYVLGVSLFLSLILISLKQELLTITVMVIFSFTLIFIVFFFTPEYKNAISYTLINRFTLGFIPMLCFFTMIVISHFMHYRQQDVE